LIYGKYNRVQKNSTSVAVFLHRTVERRPEWGIVTMKIKQIILSPWKRFLGITGLASVIEVLSLFGEETKGVDSRK
jgi:hypothetical protein